MFEKRLDGIKAELEFYESLPEQTSLIRQKIDGLRREIQAFTDSLTSEPGSVIDAGFSASICAPPEYDLPPEKRNLFEGMFHLKHDRRIAAV